MNNNNINKIINEQKKSINYYFINIYFNNNAS